MSEEAAERRELRKQQAKSMSHAEMRDTKSKMDRVLEMIDHDLARNEEVMKTLGTPS